MVLKSEGAGRESGAKALCHCELGCRMSNCMITIYTVLMAVSVRKSKGVSGFTPRRVSLASKVHHAHIMPGESSGVQIEEETTSRCGLMIRANHSRKN